MVTYFYYYNILNLGKWNSYDNLFCFLVLIKNVWGMKPKIKNIKKECIKIKWHMI